MTITKKSNGGKSTISKFHIDFDWFDVRYIIVKSENQLGFFRRLLDSLKCDNNTIGIFTQKRVRQDFIGVAHNIRKDIRVH